jgi:NADPH:quinone reductase-like Zn-dependent oxidoreductase
VRAYRLERFGGLDGIDAGEQPEPKPGAGEAVVRVEARSLNFRDALILENRYAVPATPGVIPVSDGAGVVVETGAGVTRVDVGDRVAASYFPRWRDGDFAIAAAMEQFGCTRDGMLAELVAVPAEALVPIPEHLSFEEAATLPCAAVTAWAAMTEPRAPLPSQTVLTIGTGGVALFALQFAKLFGARAVAVTSSAEKAALLEGHGADVVIDRTAIPDWERSVREATGGAGVDLVVETGSIETLPRSLASCAAGAHVALIAALGDAVLDARALSMPVTIRRSFVGSRAHFEAMNRAIAQHRLRPVVDRTFAFDGAKDAYAHFLEKRHVGKVVIGG